VYNLCRVKIDISVMLMVKSGLDPHMINELEDELNHEPCL
jgi:RNA-binding protein YhbY